MFHRGKTKNKKQLVLAMLCSIKEMDVLVRFVMRW